LGIVFLHGSIIVRNTTSEPVELLVGGHCTLDLRAYRNGRSLAWRALGDQGCPDDGLVIVLWPGASHAFRSATFAFLPPSLYRVTVVLIGAKDVELAL
jgi:hypothetical protein